MMPKINKNIVIGISIAVILVFIIILIYAFGQKGKIAQVEESTVEEILTPLDQGEIGETEETLKGEKVIIPGPSGAPEIILPAVILNSSGQIKEIKENGLIIAGDGPTFADLKPRDLTLLYTATTQTVSPDRTKIWKGLEGLKHLKVGQQIIFESPENIRGKIEFKVSYVNQL